MKRKLLLDTNALTSVTDDADQLSIKHHHRDPFDRLMIAQALEEDWEVISSDSQWDAYGIKRIW